jgi:hypothetical protein
MLKLTTTIGVVLFFGSSWATGEMVPRLTHTGANFVLMPLCGYLVLIAAAHCAARLFPETERR